MNIYIHSSSDQKRCLLTSFPHKLKRWWSINVFLTVFAAPKSRRSVTAGWTPLPEYKLNLCLCQNYSWQMRHVIRRKYLNWYFALKLPFNTVQRVMHSREGTVTNVIVYRDKNIYSYFTVVNFHWDHLESWISWMTWKSCPPDVQSNISSWFILYCLILSAWLKAWFAHCFPLKKTKKTS